MCHSVTAVVGLVGVPRPNTRWDTGSVPPPQNSAEVLLHMLKNAESNAELKSLEAPGWLNWLSVRLLILAQVTISGL